MSRKILFMLLVISISSLQGCQLIPGKSTDSALKSLTVSKGALLPIFSPGTLSYTDTVQNDVASITVTPTANDANASIKVNGATVTSGSASGAIALIVGANSITIVVTAEDGTTKSTYSIGVSRLPLVASDTVNMLGWWQVTSCTPKNVNVNGSLAVNNDPITELRVDATLGDVMVYVHAYYNLLIDANGKLQMNRWATMLNLWTVNLTYAADGTTVAGVEMVNDVTSTTCTLGIVCANDTVKCDYEFLPAVVANGGDITAIKTGDEIDSSVYPIKSGSNPPVKDTTAAVCAIAKSGITVVNTAPGAEKVNVTGDPLRTVATFTRVTDAAGAAVMAAPIKNKVKVCPWDACALFAQ